MKLTTTEYSLTTSAQLDCKILEEMALYLVLRLRGETEYDANDNQDPDRLPHKAHETLHLT